MFEVAGNQEDPENKTKVGNDSSPDNDSRNKYSV